MEQIAPHLFSTLNADQVYTLVQLRSSLAQTVDAWQPATIQFTDHSMAHNDAILSVVEAYVAGQDARLNEIETFVLVAAIYLHDIGLVAGEILRDAQGRLPIECWPPDVRKHHARLSAALVREFALQEQAGVELPVFGPSVAGLVADLCQSHDRIESLHRLETRRKVDNVDTRPRLLAALLTLGDSLHTGRSRVLLQNLGLAQLPIQGRLFWYRYACIESVHVAPPTVTLTLLRSHEIDSKSFKLHVRDPIYQHFTQLLDRLNPILCEFGFSALTCDAHTRVGDFPGTAATTALLTTAVLESEIRKRNDDRKKAIACTGAPIKLAPGDGWRSPNRHPGNLVACSTSCSTSKCGFWRGNERQRDTASLLRESCRLSGRN